MIVVLFEEDVELYVECYGEVEQCDVQEGCEWGVGDCFCVVEQCMLFVCYQQNGVDDYEC